MSEKGRGSSLFRVQRETKVGSSVVHLLIGPEGRLTLEEAVEATASGWIPAGLGETVLRADTAAVAAVARYGL